ncbi:helix-turn-helix transcriptional regulator [Ammonicoccus fulvus]|uniref:Helix-turn-helix transcriptional regulator n=1 Tax=Ammonicoccus fulvus TaxID=3138240 RepID=A0ABZ3FNQ7_9ACTN
MGNIESAEDRFGRNVRRIREELGMTQKDLAEAIGRNGVTLHPSAIAKIELRDVDNPRAIRLTEAEAIARCLNRTVADLMDRDAPLLAAAAADAGHAADMAERSADALESAMSNLDTARVALDFQMNINGSEADAHQQRVLSALDRLQAAHARQRASLRKAMRLGWGPAKDKGEK